MIQRLKRFIPILIRRSHVAVSTGMIEINSAAARARRSPVEIVTDFGVVSLALVGRGLCEFC